MKTSDGKEYFGLELDLTKFRHDINEARRSFSSIGDKAEQEGMRIDNAFSNIGRKVAGAFAVGTLVEFERKIISVRSEMESLQISFETLAGKQVGRQLYNDIKQFAVNTPMLIGDLSKGAQTMLGFGISAEKVMPILRQIGDISMGDAQRFNSLSLAFAQMSSTGKLMGQELLQMINAGFNPLTVIAEKTGKSVAKLKDEMSNGRISVEMVEDAFRAATEEGGKFYGMLEKQSKGIKGALSNLEGAWQDMLNDLGEKQQGVLLQGIDLATDAVNHYETFAKVLLSVIAAYGSYKAVLLLTAAAHKAVAMYDNIRLMMMFRKELGLATAAQQAFNLAAKANPYVMLLSVLTGIVTATLLFTRRTDEATAAQNKLNDAFNDTQGKIASEQKNIDNLFDSLRNAEKGTTDYKKAKDAILSQYGHYLEGMNSEISTLKDVEGAYKAVAQAAREATLARGREAALGEANENYGKTYSANIGKLQESLQKRTTLGSNDIANYLKQVQKELRETGTISTATEKKIRGALRGTADYGNSEAWFTTLRNNELELKQAVERTDQLFQLEDKKTEKSTAKAKNLGKAYTEAEEAYAKAHAKVEAMKKNRKAYTEQDWADAQEAEKNAKKTLENLGGDPEGKKGKELASEASKLSKEQHEYLDLQEELADERKRRSYDLWAETEQAEIDAMREGSAKTVRQIELDFSKRKEELRRQYEDLRRQKFEEDKRLWEADPSNKNKPFAGNVTDDKYDPTDEETEHFRKLGEAARKYYGLQLEDARDNDLQAMREYLKEYGSLEQQKLSVTEEYEQKIRNAKTDGERLKLRKELDTALSQQTFKNLSMGIDWNALFNGVGAMSRQMMEAMQGKLKSFVKTDEFRSADADTQQKVTELLGEIREYLGSDHDVKWQDLASAMQDFNRSVIEYRQAQYEEQDAIRQRDEARSRLEDGTGSSQELDEASRRAEQLGAATAAARRTMEGFGASLNNASDAVVNYTSKLDTALKNAAGWSGLDGFSELQSASKALSNMKGDVGKELAEQLSKLMETDKYREAQEAYDSGEITKDELDGIIGDMKGSFSGLTDKMSGIMGDLGNGLGSILESGIGQMMSFWLQIPKLILQFAESIKNFVTGILDSFTELLEFEWLSDLVVSITDAIGNLIDAIFDLPENIFKMLEGIVVDGVGGLINTVLGRVGNILTLGALSSKGPADWFTNGNGEDVANTINRLTDRNKLLQQAIEDLTDEMKTARGASAIDASKRAIKLQEETNANYKEIAQAQAGYHNAHHSWNYYWGGFDNEQVSRLSKQIGRNWSGDLWDLSPDEMKILRSNVDMWEHIQNTGKGGYGKSVAEKLNDYIEQAGKLQEITDALYENLTTTTKENVFDDFLNSLYELADGSEDVFDDIAENWQKMVNRMVINNLVGAKFQENLEKWYEELAKLNESKTNGEITDAEYKKRIDALKSQYEAYVNGAKSDIEQLRTEGIIQAVGDEDSATNQSSTKKGYATASQDSIDELNGRFAGLMMIEEQSRGFIETSSADIAVIREFQAQHVSIAGEIRNLAVLMVSHLEDISKYARHLVQIDENVQYFRAKLN